MGLLRERDGDRYVALAARSMVGRSEVCALRIDDPQISREHACFMWTEEGWQVRDLGSRNGISVNGARLPPGSTARLQLGDEIVFGSGPGGFSLVDDTAPVALARSLATREVRPAEGGLIALPSPEEPAACVFEAPGGGWTLEIGGRSCPAHDGDVIHVAGAAWMLHLPASTDVTADANDRGPTLGEVELSFRVSPDEEYVEVAVVQPGAVHVVPSRAHHYTLLTLARRRLGDALLAGLGEEARGWVDVDELCRMLLIDENRLNVEIFRIRRELVSLGIRNAAAIVERRRGSRKLRIGASRLSVSPMR